MPETVNIYEAKTHLSRLVERAAAGEEIIISRAGRPVARLCSLEPAARKITFGLLEGAVEIGADFDEPLPEGVLASFEGL